ncbi:hypothetical protein HLI_20930 [Halobacillus litoralis]|uniref:AB hydrolase-1 domain-containing protein n=1 Tax=Halobacillus litoralis TaxID=45668 RepID=A0A410MIM9_9BACI|nr:hypothetical protein HLI_20930 [Halobacillus litoralis]
MLEYLREDYQLILVDMPGHGFSPRLEGSINEYTGWLHEIVIELRIDSCHIIGHSIGGDLALAYCRSYPEAVQTVVLLDGGYMRGNALPDYSLAEELEVTDKHIHTYVFSSWLDYESKLKEAGFSNKRIELSKDTMMLENGNVRLRVDHSTALSLVKAFYDEPSSDSLQELTRPVLLLRSTEPDMMNKIRRKECEHFSKYASLTVIDLHETGHDLYGESPYDVCQEIKAWVESGRA